MTELPQNWIEAQVGSLIAIRNGYAFKSQDFLDKGNVPAIRQTNLSTSLVNFKNPKFLPENYLDLYAQFRIKKGDWLIGLSGSVGNLALYNESSPALQNQRTGLLVPRISDSLRFVRYYLERIQVDLAKTAKGVAIQNISSRDIENWPIPVPPLNEQIRIANKLDSLLAKVNNAQTRLEKIPNLLKRFRQSVLAAATSGELTREWRGSAHKNSKWNKVQLGDIAKVFTGVTPLKKETAYYQGGTIPWLTSSVTGQKLVKNAENFVTEKAIKECRLKLFKPGTLLIAMYGEGKTRGQVTEIAIEAAINQACAAVIVDCEETASNYVRLCIENNYEKTRMMAEGGNQPNLNLSKVRSIPINLPPRLEQKEIVRRVESLFALADKVEKQYTQAKKAVDALTQSLLAKAFRGELVPQNPNDEPAEVLLKRIQDERQQQANKPKRKIRNSAKKSQKASTMKLNQAPENYLHDLLTQLDGEAHAEALWQKSALAIDDFYAKLKQEMHCGHIIDDNKSPDPTLRKLKITQ